MGVMTEGSGHVLVVDDDEAVRIVLVETLRSDGHDVACAADGGEALLMMERMPLPRLLILDLMMPRVSGCAGPQSNGAEPSAGRYSRRRADRVWLARRLAAWPERCSQAHRRTPASRSDADPPSSRTSVSLSRSTSLRAT